MRDHNEVEICTIWHSSSSAAVQMGKIVDQCDLTNRIIATDGRIAGGAPLATRAGFVAEELHAESFNLDAILKDKDTRAFTDRYNNTPLSSNDPVNDIVITEDGKVVKGAQLKYYQNGQKTANAFCESGSDGKPHYQETDSMVCPSDQLNDVKEAARRTELKNGETRPQVSEAAKQVQEKVSDRIEHEGVSSSPVSKRDAEQVAKGSDEGIETHNKIQNGAKNASTLQQTAKAATSAALVTTVIAGTINTVSCLNKVQKGQMTSDEAIKYILTNTAMSACDSTLKAAGATAAVSTATRYLPQFFSGSVLHVNLAAGSVACAAVCAIDLVECLVSVAAGKMSWQELETRTGKNIFQTGSGGLGASIGAALCAPAGPIGAALGAVVGGMITSIATTVAIENHVEKPFRETMANTQSLVESGEVMKNAVGFLACATAKMDDFKIGLYRSERDFDAGMDRNRRKIASNWEKINSLREKINSLN